MIILIILIIIILDAVFNGLTPLNIAIALMDYLLLPARLFWIAKDKFYMQHMFKGWVSFRRKTFAGRLLLFITKHA